MSDARNDLVSILQRTPNDPSIAERVSALEQSHPADLSRDSELLEGVWDLRWSSSSQPWLRQAPWLENLQVLDPAKNRGCNLLRLRGPFGSIGAISVQADLEVINDKRVEVKFRKGGWLGPSLQDLANSSYCAKLSKASQHGWTSLTWINNFAYAEVMQAQPLHYCVMKASPQPNFWNK